MPKEFNRTDRIADQIQRDLSALIRMELKDPRVGMVTVNGVRVARDLGYADVYITLLSAQELGLTSPEVQSSLSALNGAAGFLRSELGKMIKLRVIPRLRFHFDESVGQGRKMESLIAQAREKDGSASEGEAG